MAARLAAPVDVAVDVPVDQGRLEHLPITLFSTVMGLGGLALAWRRAAHVWALPDWTWQILFWVAVAVFALITTLYAAKWARHAGAARAELRHPVRMTFAPTITISLLILATAGQDLVPTAARVAWWVGALGQLALTLAVVTAWFGRADITHNVVTPAWLIPVVGNILTPLAAARLGSVDLAWFAFGIGAIFWVGLFPLLLQRVLLHEQPLPGKLLPTLAIFIAPPAVGLLSWQSLTGQVDDPLGRILYAGALAFTALLLAQAARLHRIPFALPYWAYSFPLAAASAAAITMADARGGLGYTIVAGVLLTVTTVLVVVVAALTVRAAARRQICVQE